MGAVLGLKIQLTWCENAWDWANDTSISMATFGYPNVARIVLSQ